MECCLDQGAGGGTVDVLISNLLRIRESPTWGNMGTWRGDETLLALLQLRTIAVFSGNILPCQLVAPDNVEVDRCATSTLLQCASRMHAHAN